MLEEQVRKDLVASFLLQKSNLTEVQLDTILASDREGNIEHKASLREKGKVSKGSFARTLNQGQENIESSIYTLFLLSYLNLVSPENLAQFSRTARMLGQLKDADPKREDLLRVVEAMKYFVHGFGGRKRKVIL
ncbi:MAG: hypothetical protein ACRDHZ_24520 [Ktedonobacteraceae bacterium]